MALAVPAVHRKDSEALMAPGPVVSVHLPRALKEAQVESLETVPVWTAPDEAEVRADLIKVKPTMDLRSVGDEVVEVAVEAVAEAAIPRPRHPLHCRTKRTPDH